MRQESSKDLVRKGRLIEGNAKCRHLKNWPVKGLYGRCLSVWGPITPYSPLHTIYVDTVYLFTHGRGGGGKLNQRSEEGQQGKYRSQSWVENTNMTECTQEIAYLKSINSDKPLPRSPFTGSIFLDDDILHWLLWVLLSIWVVARLPSV